MKEYNETTSEMLNYIWKHKDVVDTHIFPNCTYFRNITDYEVSKLKSL